VQAAGPNAIGFFYYSGHGASDGSTNYLIPTDVKTTEAGELWDRSLRLADVTRRLKAEAGNATHFVVFDACRNTLKLTQPGSRALVQSKGFVPVSQENGMLIAYATAEGELASDVGTSAGPYAKVLADEVVKPGVEAVAMFRIVQRRVRAAIRQEPYLGFSALGDVFLAGKDAKPSEPAATQARLSEAAEAWDRTKDTASVVLLELFITRYKDTFYADLAKVRIEELKRREVAAASPTAAGTTPAEQTIVTASPGSGQIAAPPGPYMRNVEITGSTSYEGTRGDSIEECQRLCASQTKCVAVEHNRPAGRCQFYDQRAMTRQNPNYDTWSPQPLRVNVPSGSPQVGVPSGPYMRNVEITGSTSYEGTRGDSIEECQRLCASQAKCVAVEYNRPAGRCQFYDQRAMTRQNPNYDTWLLQPQRVNVPSGSAQVGVPSGPYMYNVEITGSTSYEGTRGDSIEECRRLCASQAKCVAVEYNRPAGRCQFYDRRSMTRQNREYDTWLRK